MTSNKPRKIASAAYIAGEYFILSGILNWVFVLIFTLLAGLVLGFALGIDVASNPAYFYSGLILFPIIYWFAVKYSALNIAKRYLVSDAKKTANFAICYKVIIFVCLDAYNFISRERMLGVWKLTSDALHLDISPYMYRILTIAGSLVSVAIFWIATKKYIKADNI
jgi:hypothetical protein